MKTSDQFPKRFMSICMGVSAVLLSGAAFMYSIKTANAEPIELPQTYGNKLQVGTNENYIPISIVDGYAYWLIFNTADGYKYRKVSLRSSLWQEKL